MPDSSRREERKGEKKERKFLASVLKDACVTAAWSFSRQAFSRVRNPHSFKNISIKNIHDKDLLRTLSPSFSLYSQITFSTHETKLWIKPNIFNSISDILRADFNDLEISSNSNFPKKIVSNRRSSLSSSVPAIKKRSFFDNKKRPFNEKMEDSPWVAPKGNSGLLHLRERGRGREGTIRTWKSGRLGSPLHYNGEYRARLMYGRNCARST